MEDVKPLRASELLSPMLTAQINPELERMLLRFREHQAKTGPPAEDPQRAFLYWLSATGEIVTATHYRRKLDHLRSDLGGDRALLVQVNFHPKGSFEVAFSMGAGREVLGKSLLREAALPRYAREGDYLIARVSRPVCAGCGWSSDDPTERPRFWVEPSVCSVCAQAAARSQRAGV